MSNHQKDNQSRFQLTEQQRQEFEQFYQGLIGDRLHHLPKRRFIVPIRPPSDICDLLERQTNETL